MGSKKNGIKAIPDGVREELFLLKNKKLVVSPEFAEIIDFYLGVAESILNNNQTTSETDFEEVEDGLIELFYAVESE